MRELLSMRHPLIIVLVAVLPIISLVACGQDVLSPGEAAALASARKKYAGVADISFRAPFYLMVTESGSSVTSDVAVQILQDCAFVGVNSHAQRAGTLFIYLNVYNSSGEFLYQVYFDSQDTRFREEHREFHHY